jgi:hypothetical protein
MIDGYYQCVLNVSQGHPNRDMPWLRARFANKQP